MPTAPGGIFGIACPLAPQDLIFIVLEADRPAKGRLGQSPIVVALILAILDIVWIGNKVNAHRCIALKVELVKVSSLTSNIAPQTIPCFLDTPLVLRHRLLEHHADGRHGVAVFCMGHNGELYQRFLHCVLQKAAGSRPNVQHCMLILVLPCTWHRDATLIVSVAVSVAKQVVWLHQNQKTGIWTCLVFTVKLKRLELARASFGCL
mmetsp:Transcript_33636/g.78619  ORF Transcript_33636/g.78619 Transcript_33636/m.78619 type:complete len:206 (+) Transcript_33636:650-1267(+)